MLYGVAMFWILREYYKDPANLGIPRPKAIAAPTYLYAILALASDFTGGFTIPLAAGMTVSLIWQTQAKNAKAGALAGVTSVAPRQSTPTPGTSQAGKKVSASQHNQ